jgi:sodium-dependent dicarboxylate transporter 2/3/5
MLVCTPLVIILLAVLYLVLTRWLYPSKITQSKHTHNFVTTELQQLGKLSGSERRVLLVFVCTAMLWITKDLLNSLNWFKLDDNMIALAGAISLFAIPASKTNGEPQGMLLHWKDTSKMAWGILLLFGGGIALANTLEKAGVMSMIGNWLAGFGHLGGFTLILVIVVISIFLSELMSNVAQVIVLAPVLAALADALNLDPLLVGIPMTLAASAASMLPMGTPPNAIVFSSGYVKMKDMMTAGLIMNLISIILITLFVWLLLPSIIHISK